MSNLTLIRYVFARTSPAQSLDRPVTFLFDTQILTAVAMAFWAMRPVAAMRLIGGQALFQSLTICMIIFGALLAESAPAYISPGVFLSIFMPSQAMRFVVTTRFISSVLSLHVALALIHAVAGIFLTYKAKSSARCIGGRLQVPMLTEIGTFVSRGHALAAQNIHSGRHRLKVRWVDAIMNAAQMIHMKCFWNSRNRCFVEPTVCQNIFAVNAKNTISATIFAANPQPAGACFLHPVQKSPHSFRTSHNHYATAAFGVIK
jgi:hypothetical protein